MLATVQCEKMFCDRSVGPALCCNVLCVVVSVCLVISDSDIKIMIKSFLGYFDPENVKLRNKNNKVSG